jgi:hypothetical protein
MGRVSYPGENASGLVRFGAVGWTGGWGYDPLTQSGKNISGELLTPMHNPFPYVLNCMTPSTNASRLSNLKAASDSPQIPISVYPSERAARH